MTIPDDPKAPASTTPAAPRHAGSRPDAPAFAPGGGAHGSGASAGHAVQAPAAVSTPPTPPAAQPLAPAERQRLDEAFRATLARGLHGLCFSPYLDGQQPGSLIGEDQIRTRLSLIAPHTRWVRSFSCTDGHEHTPRIAHELGLKTLVGAWLGTDAGINARELAGLVEVARAGHADLVAVGNEVLLRGDLDEDALIGHIEQVRRALPGIPVGYVDAYFLFEKHPRVTAACDVVLSNCYPFWEGCPREQALAYLQTMVARCHAAAPGKRVIVSETGWPDQGSAFHGAVPGHEAAMQYLVDMAAWAEREGIEWFHFAAFDEAWKVGAEGDVGAFWGLWDQHARLKFG